MHCTCTLSLPCGHAAVIPCCMRRAGVPIRTSWVGDVISGGIRTGDECGSGLKMETRWWDPTGGKCVDRAERQTGTELALSKRATLFATFLLPFFSNTPHRLSIHVTTTRAHAVATMATTTASANAGPSVPWLTQGQPEHHTCEVSSAFPSFPALL